MTICITFGLHSTTRSFSKGDRLATLLFLRSIVFSQMFGILFLGSAFGKVQEINPEVCNKKAVFRLKGADPAVVRLKLESALDIRVLSFGDFYVAVSKTSSGERLKNSLEKTINQNFAETLRSNVETGRYTRYEAEEDIARFFKPPPFFGLKQINWTSMQSPVSMPPAVAVLDNGVFMDHPALTRKKMYFVGSLPRLRIHCGASSNGLDVTNLFHSIGRKRTCTTGRVDYPHGTKVAGIIAADRERGTSKSVLIDARIIPIKVTQRRNSVCGINVALGMFAANDLSRLLNRPITINLSLGIKKIRNPVTLALIEHAVREASNRDNIVVAAVGNGHSEACNEKVYPASFSGSFKNVISVGAFGRNYSVIRPRGLYWSNFGKCVNIAAPGEGITSTALKKRYFAKINKSSAATPFVAATAAQIQAMCPKLGVRATRTTILDSSTYGRYRLIQRSLNFASSLQNAVKNPNCR